MRFVNDQTQLINSEHEKRLPHACNSNLIDPGFIKRGPSQFDDPSQSLTANMLAFTRKPGTTATQRPFSRYLRFS
jgi:hypothetical protein